MWQLGERKVLSKGPLCLQQIGERSMFIFLFFHCQSLPLFFSVSCFLLLCSFSLFSHSLGSNTKWLINDPKANVTSNNNIHVPLTSNFQDEKIPHGNFHHTKNNISNQVEYTSCMDYLKILFCKKKSGSVSISQYHPWWTMKRKFDRN